MTADHSLQYLSMAFLLGLSAGLSPGPLLTLVITQTIKYNKREGIKVAISPLITDTPIVLIALFIFKKLTDFDIIIAMISLLGGLFIAYLGIDALRTKNINLENKGLKSESYKKGIIANFLNPHPYIFWLTVNAPLVYKAYEHSPYAAVLYLLTFYSLLIGSKIIVAIIISKTKNFIHQGWYSYIMKLLGFALLFFSLLFFYDALKYFVQ